MLKRPYGATGPALKGFVIRVEPDTNRQNALSGVSMQHGLWEGPESLCLCVPETPVDDGVNERSWNLGPQLHVGPAWASG